MALVPVSDVQVLKTLLKMSKSEFQWKVNESFIKACRDGDLAKFADLVDRADVNYVSESGQSQQPVTLFLPFWREPWISYLEIR